MIFFINQHQNNSLLIFEPHSSNFIRINVTTLQLTRTEYSTCPGSQVDSSYITVLYLFMFSITARTACLRLTGQESLVYRSLLSALALALASQRRQVLLCDNCSFMCMFSFLCRYVKKRQVCTSLDLDDGVASLDQWRHQLSLILLFYFDGFTW